MHAFEVAPATSITPPANGFVIYGSLRSQQLLHERQRRNKLILGSISMALGLVLVLMLTYSHYRDVFDSNVVVATWNRFPKQQWISAEPIIPASMYRDMDVRKNPCNHFYGFACDGFDRRSTIPEEELEWARGWDGADKKIKERLKNVIAADSGSVGTYYQSCMNMNLINSKGVDPIRPYLLAIDTVNTIDDLVDITAYLHRRNIPCFFDWDIVANPFDLGKNGFNLLQGGLSLPDASYYTDAKYADMRATFKSVIAKMLELTGMSPEKAEEEAQMAYDVEATIARLVTPRAESRQTLPKGYTLKQLTMTAPTWRFPRFFQKLAGNDRIAAEIGPEGNPNILYDDNAYYIGIDGLISSHPVSYFKPYLRWRATYILGEDLSEDFLDAGLALNKKLEGVSKRLDRWRKCFDSVSTALPDAVGQMYIKNFFSEDDREMALVMLAQLRAVLRQELQTLPWMEPQTRLAAVNKLDHMLFEVGYPEQWHSYTFKVDLDTFFENTMRARMDDVGKALDRLTKSVNRRRWGSTGVTDVDAYYSRQLNTLFVPAGILQPPFFGKDFAAARNWGSIGVVMGHEITHAFDDVGRKFDEQGRVRNWWTPTDENQFESRAECIVDQYGGYSVGNEQLDGNLTLGEAIADEGGLKLAYKAFLIGADTWAKQNGGPSDDVRRAVEAATVAEFADTMIIAKNSQTGNPMLVVQKVMQTIAKQATREAARNVGGMGATLGEKQLFFISWGQTWCSITRPQAAKLKLLTDEHAPDKYRVVGPLSQFPPFSEAFSCPVGSEMHPDQACVLW